MILNQAERGKTLLPESDYAKVGKINSKHLMDRVAEGKNGNRQMLAGETINIFKQRESSRDSANDKVAYGG